MCSAWINKQKTTFDDYSRDKATLPITGQQMAQEILRQSGSDITIAETPVPRQYTDRYDTKKRSLILSRYIHNNQNMVGLAFAAYQAVWALRQRKHRAARKGWNAVYLIIGILFLAPPVKILLWEYMQLTALEVLFFPLFLLLFLVVCMIMNFQELSIRKEALGFLRESGYLNEEQLKNAKEVLRAASFRRMTYLFIQ